MPTQLGGGQLGYLALVLTTTECATIPNTTPFTRPADPGTFQYVPSPQLAPASMVSTRASSRHPSGTPTAQGSTSSTPSSSITIDITQQKAQHNKRKRRYYECQAIGQALWQQLIEAIAPEYLEPWQDPITYMIQDPIPDIISFLQDTYGSITPQEIN